MHDLLQAAEDLPDPALTVTFCSQQFALPEKENTPALMDYAEVAVSGVDSGSLVGLAAMKALLRASLGPSFPEFWELVTEQNSSGDELFEVVKDVYAAYADRPTSRPSDSSGGPSSTEANSADDAFLRAKLRFEAKGRPDQAALVLAAQRFEAG